METLPALIKIYQQQLDDKRRELTEMEEERQNLVGEIENLQNSLQDEMVHASESPETSFTLLPFAKQVRVKQEQIIKMVMDLDGRLQELAIAISEAFSELKKFEILYEQKLEEEAAEIDRKERIELDDLGSERHQRKKQSNS